MFEQINKKKLAGIVLAGVLTVSGTTYAFAADQGSNGTQAANQKQFFKFDTSKTSAAIKSAIDNLVSAGTITQAQADAVAEAYTTGDGKVPIKFVQKNYMDDLVAAGTITQAEADAVTSAMKSGIESKGTPADALKELVSAGTITQAQADTMQKAIRPFEGKSIAVKFKNNPLDDLVAGGTLTQAQADAINNAIKAAISPIDKK